MSGNEEVVVEVDIEEKNCQKMTDGKTSSTIAQKKMIQARLPFKRLNPVPRDEGSISQGKKPKMVQKVSVLNTEPLPDQFAEDVENGCRMENVEVQSLPKAINGRGPLDSYVKRLSHAHHVKPCITIDLTEDSNSGPIDHLSSIGRLQLRLTNESVLKNSESFSETDEVLTDANNLKNNDNGHDVHAEEIAEVTYEPSFTTMLLSVPLTNCANAKLSSPVKACKDVNNVAVEDSAPLSSHSSPASSPEGLIAAVLKKEMELASPKHIHKESEVEEKKQKLKVVKEERDRIREELKVAKERAKEEAKKKKDGEREQKAKEKKERKEKEDREKAEKLRLKEEKKKEKLEALEAKQEEKRKKEEDKRIKEEEKRLKAEKAEITRFLQKSKSSHTPKTFAQSCGKFAPFEIKKNMAVAPLCRVEFEPENLEQLDKFLKEQNPKVNFLLELRSRIPRSMGRTQMPEVPLFASDTDDVQVIVQTDATLQHTVQEQKRLGKMKLLQFSENYRPAYWGTWNKLSTVICPRKPWAQDTSVLDYEVDSDEEWEEEEPGESLSHSEGDDEDDAKEEEEEDDDGFFVPHGYLSEDEGGVSDEECTNPEKQKVRQRLKAKEWDELQAKGKKINVLKPIIIGCVWFGRCTPEMTFLQRFAACVLDTVIPIEEDLVQECNTIRSPEDREILLHLLPLLHGNVNGSKVIIQEFQECCRRSIISLRDSVIPHSVSPNSQHQVSSCINIPSKARLKRIISENSVYEKRPDHRMCWYVHDDILKSFQQESLPVPSQWTYVTQLIQARDDLGNSCAQILSTPTSSKRKSTGSMPITMFMRKAAHIGLLSDAGVDEMDGFQADTEDDDDEDDDICMIVDEQKKKDTDVPCRLEVSLSEEVATAPLQT